MKRRTREERRRDRSVMVDGLLLIAKGLALFFAIWYVFHR